MRCLVTGGAGFIGSHLVEALVRGGHNVVVYDNLSNEYSPDDKRRNLFEADPDGRYVFLQSDVRDSVPLTSAMYSHRPEVVFHLAALPGVRRSVQAPALCAEMNITGTIKVLEAMALAGVDRLVYASSSSVYGVGAPIPFEEDRTGPVPISPYAVSKLAGEHLCHTYYRLHGIRTTCLRLFTVYGPRQRPDLAIHKFIRAILEGGEVPVFGDGGSGRDYTWCGDAVNALLAAADLPHPFEIINVASGRIISPRELIGILGSVSGLPVRTRHFPAQPGDLEVTAADLAKARRLLGYRPSVSFEDGIRAQLEWHRQRPAPAP